MVIACDGIWDELSSEQVVASVCRARDTGNDPSTNVIMDSLLHAGKQFPGGVGELLSVPPPQCRRYRDDMTVHVCSLDANLPLTAAGPGASTDVPVLDLAIAKEARPDRVSQILLAKGAKL